MCNHTNDTRPKTPTSTAVLIPFSPRCSSSLSNNDHTQQDTEIQAWILDLHNNGYALREGETDHGIPSSLTSIEQLTHLLTMVIFTCACQHAAVNFSQMDSLGFPPSSPALMRQPPPTEKGKLTLKDMVKSLPTKHQTGVTIVTLYDLTRIYPDEVNKRVFIHRQVFYFLDLFMSTCSCMPLNYHFVTTRLGVITQIVISRCWTFIYSYSYLDSFNLTRTFVKRFPFGRHKAKLK